MLLYNNNNLNKQKHSNKELKQQQQKERKKTFFQVPQAFHKWYLNHHLLSFCRFIKGITPKICTRFILPQ